MGPADLRDMTAIPRTTKLSPDQATLRGLMQRLAGVTSTDALVLSIYVDIRPEAHGERPGERPELSVVIHRLKAIQATFRAHTAARESLDADLARIEGYFESAELAAADGLALFACSRIGLWQELRAAEPFDTQVATGRTADLFQLARLLDDSESAVVAVVDTNSCRLFVTRRGGLEEREGPDEPSDDHRRHDQGGWSQARYQRHIDYHDKRFAKEAAAAIEQLVQRERAQHVILAGDERAIPFLEEELSEPVRAVVDQVTHLQMRSSPDEVRAEMAPILAAIEEAEAKDLADRAIAEWLAGDLGVVGIDASMAALELGQVDWLVIDETAGIAEEVRARLIRQAALTDASVEVVRDHAGLAQHGGVAATLRFRI
jgi:peptide chain release factor subunit 1